MRLLLLVALVLVALIIYAVIRARRISRAKRAAEVGWYAHKWDGESATHIQLRRAGEYGGRALNRRLEASIPYNDPFYGERVIEEYAAAEAKAEDRNSTNRALAT
jgi:hypothetical protein